MSEKDMVDILVIANVSSEQIPQLTKKLNQERFFFTQIASSRGLIHLSTSTLLIGIQSSRYNNLMKLIHTYCKKKRTHIATQTQMEAQFHPPHPVIIEAETGGATLLTLPVCHFEQY
jgi:uncharacterized protein YaaQ